MRTQFVSTSRWQHVGRILTCMELLLKLSKFALLSFVNFIFSHGPLLFCYIIQPVCCVKCSKVSLRFLITLWMIFNHFLESVTLNVLFYFAVDHYIQSHHFLYCLWINMRPVACFFLSRFYLVFIFDMNVTILFKFSRVSASIFPSVNVAESAAWLLANTITLLTCWCNFLYLNLK